MLAGSIPSFEENTSYIHKLPGGHNDPDSGTLGAGKNTSRSDADFTTVYGYWINPGTGIGPD